MTRKQRKTAVDLAPLSTSAVDGLVWAAQFGISPTDATTEALWRRERSEKITVELPCIG